MLHVICVYVQVRECVIERLCKELCNRIEGHLPPCAAHGPSTVPKGSQQHWQPARDRANFVSLEIKKKKRRRRSWEKVGCRLLNSFNFNCIFFFFFLWIVFFPRLKKRTELGQSMESDPWVRERLEWGLEMTRSLHWSTHTWCKGIPNRLPWL